VSEVLDAGYRTGDIYSEGATLVGCQGMGAALLEILKKG
jgi:3-isopropylmalate dehydrogenase